MIASPEIDPAIVSTHNALFDTWFPLTELPIPPSILPDITEIAATVCAGMLEAFSTSPVFPLLQGMTYPQGLPFFDCLARSKNAAVESFLSSPGGFGGMPAEQRTPLFSFLFDGACGMESMKLAMLLRSAYLSGIWNFPLAVPISEIPIPPVFISDVRIYAKRHAPRIAPGQLLYDSATKTIRHQHGPIDYLIVGSGPGGATVAHELQRSGKRVVLIEKGPFVVWGSMNTMSYSGLMYQQDQAATVDNGILIRSGETLGGGSTVNIDLAFSPLEGSIQARINEWIQRGLIDARFYSPAQLATAYQWVRQMIGTRAVTESEIDRENSVLWNGANTLGVDPSLFHLNRFPTGLSPSPVTEKRDAARQLLLSALQDPQNPLSIIPDARVDEIRFEPTPDGANVRATGVCLTVTAPWTEYGNTVVDPCNLQIPIGTSVTIDAANVVLAAGTIGTTHVLLNSAQKTPLIANPRIGKGPILHPSLQMLGVFDKRINLLEGLDSATFLDAFGVAPGFIFETMAGPPGYIASFIPGNGKQVYEKMSRFNSCGGIGIMLVDTPSDSNSITVDDATSVNIQYTLSEADKTRFRTGVGIGIRMMFLGGAKQVIIPSNENLLGTPDFDPMEGVYLTHIDQAELVERNLQFMPNRTILAAAHLQAANKIGPTWETSVVSTRQRLWNVRGEEVPNVYVMDSSIFPTSVGANPMQSIYTFARIFSARLLRGLDIAPSWS